MELARDTVALLLCRLDDARADKFILLHRLDLPYNSADLRAEITENRSDGKRHVLGTLYHRKEIAQADLELVALHAHRLLLLALNREVDLDDRDRLIALSNLLLRMLGEVPAHLGKPLLRPLLVRREGVHARDRIRDILFKLCEPVPCLVHLIARILIDVKNLRLIVLDRVDRIGQEPAQLSFLKALFDPLVCQIGTRMALFLTRTHPSPPALCHAPIVPHFPVKVTQTSPLHFS